MIYVVIGAVVLLLVGAVGIYNSLVRARNKVEDAWAGIDVQLQRRADLVPNLVRTVEGYKIHEQEVLVEVAEARASLVAAKGARDNGLADERLESSLGRLFAVAEAYPDLKASENFLDLQRQLGELEEEISFSRRYYNGSVEQLNTRVQTFPTVLLAGAFGFSKADFFKSAPGAEVTPTIEFGA